MERISARVRNMRDYTVKKAETAEEYNGLRDLWHRVFGDEPEFVDHVYRTFGETGLPGGMEASQGAGVTGYIICGAENEVISVLTCYRCGALSVPCDMRDDPEYAGFDGRPVYVSYAVCTDPEYRGLGLAGMLTSRVREEVTAAGGISLVSPAEESLIAFYRDLGYRESCFAAEDEAPADDPEEWDHDSFDLNTDDTRVWGLGADGTPGFIEDDDTSPAETELTVEVADVITYNKYRESFLTDTPHVSLSEPMLELVRSVSLSGDGMLVINGGDAVCVISESDGCKTQLVINELLVDPDLLALSGEIGGEIASSLAGHFGAERVVYRTPAFCGNCNEAAWQDEGIRCQSMSAGTGDVGFYFGFPVE